MSKVKVGILSDTHGYIDPAIHRYFAECDEIWHAGDIGSDDAFRELAAVGPRLRAVCGNIDSGLVRLRCPEMLEFDVAGASVVLTHIGGYPGRYAPGMRKHLAEVRPNIMVCGHSHILRVMPDPTLGLLHVNPGAAGRHGWQQVRTLVRLTIEDAVPKDLEVIELGHRGYCM